MYRVEPGVIEFYDVIPPMPEYTYIIFPKNAILLSD